MIYDSVYPLSEYVLVMINPAGPEDVLYAWMGEQRDQMVYREGVEVRLKIAK